MRIYTMLTVVVTMVLCTASCEVGPPSDPINMDNLVGTYVPNHSGVETLQIRPDYMWVRTYKYPDGTVAVDSGGWRLDTLYRGSYELVLNDMFHRHPEWARSEYLLEHARRYDGSPTKPTDWHHVINYYRGRMRIRVFPEGSPRYQKIK